MTELIPGDFSYLKTHAKEVNRAEFWKEVIAQLNKDLVADTANTIIEEHWQGEEAAEVLVKWLEAYLPSVTPRLSELLYRIDISEENAARLKGLPTYLYYRILAEMVLKRLVQKVLTRMLLSDK